MKRIFALVICTSISGISCSSQDDVSDSPSETDGPPTGPCSAGITACSEDRIYRCSDETWTAATDCAADGKTCSMVNDVAQCISGTESDSGVDPSIDFPNVPCNGAPTFVGRHGHLKVEDGTLQNECGHPIQLKGVSSMWLNWETKPYAENLDALKWMVDNWNVRIIRAAMGTDDTYYDDPPKLVGYLVDKEKALGQLTAIIDNAVELGIYVIIDWHGHTAYNHTDEAVAFFSEMAKTYGELPNVLYETFNEPRKVSWADDIKPYHEKTIAAIRQHDPDNIIILGTPVYSQRVDEALADPLTGTNLMYTVHFYACTHKQEERSVMTTAADAGLPIFVTEWGATPSDGGISEKTVCEDEADKWLNEINSRGISWLAWKLDGCADTSCLLKAGAPVDGNWDEHLQGHGPYVIDKLSEPPSPASD